MNIYIWEYEPFQYVTTTANNSIDNSSYFYGVCITPNKNCSISKIKFLLYNNNPLVGTLKIGEGNRAQSLSSAETYTVTATDNPNGIYELSVPYSLTANTNYCVVFKTTSGNLVGMNTNMSSVYPVVCDDITYNYGVDSSNSSALNGYAFGISGLEITTS